MGTVDQKSTSSALVCFDPPQLLGTPTAGDFVSQNRPKETTYNGQRFPQRLLPKMRNVRRLTGVAHRPRIIGRIHRFWHVKPTMVVLAHERCSEFVSVHGLCRSDQNQIHQVAVTAARSVPAAIGINHRSVLVSHMIYNGVDRVGNDPQTRDRYRSQKESSAPSSSRSDTAASSSPR